MAATVTIRRPILVAPVLDDPELVLRLAKANGPYFMPARYLVGSQSTKGAAGRENQHVPKLDPNLLGPSFRGDWAFDKPLIDSMEPLWHHEGFMAAAAEMYDATIVRPQQVYINLATPMGRQPYSHRDIPHFRGIDRSNAPGWFLSALGESGLFEDYRITTVTAVAWFYRGEGGNFRYWPRGADAESDLHDDTWNTAIVADTEFMHHRVERVGPRGDHRFGGMTLDSQLECDGEQWHIVEAGERLKSYVQDEVRISISWKAQVFADDDERRRVDENLDPITVDQAIARFEDDLARTLPRTDETPLTEETRQILTESYREFHNT